MEYTIFGQRSIITYILIYIMKYLRSYLWVVGLQVIPIFIFCLLVFSFIFLNNEHL